MYATAMKLEIILFLILAIAVLGIAGCPYIERKLLFFLTCHPHVNSLTPRQMGR